MRIIWVGPDGSDTTGDGSYATPYLTIEHAILFFASGDQIRLKDGIYTPVDTLSFIGVSGSLFADTPLGATIQPQQTLSTNAVIQVQNTPQFAIFGVNVKQASNPANSKVGISALGVNQIIVHTCTVSEFDAVSGVTPTMGITVSGSGRIENCDVYSLASIQEGLFGISVTGDVHVLDCSVYSLSGGNGCLVYPISVSYGA